MAGFRVDVPLDRLSCVPWLCHLLYKEPQPSNQGKITARHTEYHSSLNYFICKSDQYAILFTLSISECQVDKLGEKGESSNGNSFFMYRLNFRNWSNSTSCSARHSLLGTTHYAMVTVDLMSRVNRVYYLRVYNTIKFARICSEKCDLSVKFVRRYSVNFLFDFF